ncbi:MAG: hypothetical protein AAGC63_05650 [Propionicimonas sp.]|nr:hypothetical protein [Propionicimonas sp.]
MDWKVVREVGTDVVTLRVGDPDSPDYRELALPMRAWIQIAESIADLDRPEPPSSWFADGAGTS